MTPDPFFRSSIYSSMNASKSYFFSSFFSTGFGSAGFDSSFSGSTIGTSKVAGATFPSFQGTDTVTFALPLPASSGTRTGP